MKRHGKDGRKQHGPPRHREAEGQRGCGTARTQPATWRLERMRMLPGAPASSGWLTSVPGERRWLPCQKDKGPVQESADWALLVAAVKERSKGGRHGKLHGRGRLCATAHHELRPGAPSSPCAHACGRRAASHSAATLCAPAPPAPHPRWRQRPDSSLSIPWSESRRRPAGGGAGQPRATHQAEVH